jgi:hypothetical protein
MSYALLTHKTLMVPKQQSERRSHWRRCIDCGVYFERALMHPDPLQRSQFGKPALLCAECNSKTDQERERASTRKDRTV